MQDIPSSDVELLRMQLPLTSQQGQNTHLPLTHLDCCAPLPQTVRDSWDVTSSIDLTEAGIYDTSQTDFIWSGAIPSWPPSHASPKLFLTPPTPRNSIGGVKRDEREASGSS